MKQIYTFLASLLSLMVFSQWSPTKGLNHNSGDRFFNLDLNKIREQIISSENVQVPVLSGKMENFRLKKTKNAEQSLEDRYQFFSYSGQSTANPARIIHLSISPYGFQAMVVEGSSAEFIDQEGVGNNMYRVHSKSAVAGKTSSNIFLCSTDESSASKFEIQRLIAKNRSSTSAKISDRKFRTLRIAISTTAEYTNYFGGVPQALAAVNATLTRVNGIFERDFGVRLILQDFPQLIYTNASSDPYSDYTTGVTGAWSVELQNNLTSTIGNSAYDLGHLFGANGGGGNSGFVGGVCQDDTASLTDLAKGAAYTSPADGKPQGDTFDIDFVAHEIGHQLGATHTFSYVLESYGTNVEPGSGSTLMGYAGITTADVQAHSDDYFHTVNIEQVLNKLQAVTCDTETSVANMPPSIAPLKNYTIPKATPFVLTATATDAENDPLTYTWEQIDNAQSPIVTIKGTETTGALFRSLPPTSSPERYFPKSARVLEGSLTNPADWESVPLVARTMNFVVTVRDNNPNPFQQQTNSATQIITVENDGPFQIESENLFTNTNTTLKWAVANTNKAPYNVQIVKIEYSTGGATWMVLADSTLNDGSQSVQLPSVASDSIFVRITALDNVFYTVKKIPLSVGSPSGEISIYPNPATDYITVTNTTDSATYSIFDMSGRLIRRAQLSASRLDVSGLAKAVYVLWIEDGGTKKKIKFVKE